ncbi:hypothetical protein [Lysinibacillus sp. NPDC093216]|uniref:hypothetical protein n=1 Tax=Lysinibacillus sp. NPDC093216 TaxID=3390576 RepID=UPI003D085AC6
MKKIYLFVIAIIIILFLARIVYSDLENTEKNEIKVYEEVSNDSPDVKINDDYNIFNSSPDIGPKYSKVLGFLPNEKLIKHIKMKSVSYPYIKLDTEQDHIIGTIIFENKGNEKLKVQSFFMQGNKFAKVKMNNSSEWAYSILYDVQPESSVEINIKIEWDKDGMNELLFFPLEHSGIPGLYNGEMSPIHRNFVMDGPVNVNNNTAKHTFDLDLKDVENVNLTPYPKWIGKNKQDIEYMINEGIVITKSPIEGMKLGPVPYNTEVDIISLDERGNSSVLMEKVKVKKNEPTYIFFDSQQLKELRTSKEKNYLMILNNREEELLADIKAVELGLKPFPTSFQTVIEFYKESD